MPSRVALVLPQYRSYRCHVILLKVMLRVNVHYIALSRYALSIKSILFDSQYRFWLSWRFVPYSASNTVRGTRINEPRGVDRDLIGEWPVIPPNGLALFVNVLSDETQRNE